MAGPGAVDLMAPLRASIEAAEARRVASRVGGSAALGFLDGVVAAEAGTAVADLVRSDASAGLGWWEWDEPQRAVARFYVSDEGARVAAVIVRLPDLDVWVSPSYEAGA